jgi:hypothetical protein
MVRMQIQFTETQTAVLREVAADRGISISAVVREAVESNVVNGRLMPSRHELLKRSLAAMGRFRSGTGDVAARHDEYFADTGEW